MLQLKTETRDAHERCCGGTPASSKLNSHSFRARLGQNARVYLTITSTADNATDLGFLLHKHPGRAQSFEVAAGKAHVFYPEATEQRCTAALMLEVDPIALVRGRRR